MNQSLKLGIAGLGTVGTGLLQLLREHGARLAQSVGRPIEVAGVSARTRAKKRGVALEGIKWFDDAERLAADASHRRVRRADRRRGGRRQGGGGGGAARPASTSSPPTRRCWPRHGTELARLAEKNGVALNFEAAVAGGIPVIKTLREALAGNQIRRVYGILNGTCNYILTQMQEEHRSFADVLAEAQAKGYAEADPTFDIGGFDTAHKLALLTSLAFGTRVAFDQIDVEGIETISQADIEAADDLGYRIKLLGVALMTESGIEQRVHPAMVPKHSAIAEVSGVTNCVAIDGDFVGNLLLAGAGRRRQGHSLGGGERHPRHRARRQAAAVRRAGGQAQGLQARQARPAPGRLLRAPLGLRPARRHGRASPAAWASAGCRSRASCSGARAARSPASMRGPKPGAPTPVILITHETTEEAIRGALERDPQGWTSVREAADDTHRAAVRRARAIAAGGARCRTTSRGTTPSAGSIACWCWRLRA